MKKYRTSRKMATIKCVSKLFAIRHTTKSEEIVLKQIKRRF
jgi:hypothetical protein